MQPRLTEDYSGEVKIMEQKPVTNKVLDAIAWGVFAVLLGAGWIVSSYYQLDTGIYLALGVGFILIALNAARMTLKINVSRFSLFIGLLALALSGAGLLGFAMPFVPTVIVLVGMFIVAEAVQKTISKAGHA
jgi:hypothetical protein